MKEDGEVIDLEDDDEGFDTIEDRIAAFRESDDTTLDLSEYDLPTLHEIPEEVYSLSKLQRLILLGQNIRSVPDRIRELPRLTDLVIEDNPIEELPDVPIFHLDWDTLLRVGNGFDLANVRGLRVVTGGGQRSTRKVEQIDDLYRALPQLTNLRAFGIGLQGVTHQYPFDIPELDEELRPLLDGLDGFPELSELSLFGVGLHHVPPTLRSLRHLRWLTLFGAGIDELPPWISELRELEKLSLGFNSLETLPQELASLPKLKHLFLGVNRFTAIPDIVFELENLEQLDVRTMRESTPLPTITEIPPAILQLPKLKELDVAHQPITTPPPEVVEQGVEAIKNYWRQRQESGIDYLCEAKLLVVGEGGAGKTSLAKKLEDPSYVLQPRETSTEGIDVIQWAFPTSLRVDDSGTERLIQRRFGVNIWDFGGQEIYHATHQFFLTRRSLYVLVSDDRKEDTDFHYWLQVVELLGGDSPLLIAQNERQNRKRDIDLSRLRARFPNLVSAFPINLADNRGLDEITRAIRHELERLPHIGTALPSTWKRVRDALDREPRHHISLDEFMDICTEQGFTRDEDKLQLSGYLHDLGICLHFQDDPILKHRVILDPKWATDAVYRVLDDDTVVSNRGRFDREDLATLWSEESYATVRDELLQLMMRFQLCYELPQRGSYLCPQLLTPDQPRYEWPTEHALVLRYEYDFMPKGILTRFTVALSHLIGDHDLVWKNGVVLERNGTKAEVVEDYGRRTISVRVVGPNTRGLLAIVDDQMDRIHQSFPRLVFDKHLPCPCAVCIERATPYSFPLRDLHSFARTGDGIQCRNSRKLVDARALLADVMPSALQRVEGVSAISTSTTPSDLVSKPRPRKASSPEVFVSYAWKSAPSVELVNDLEQAFEGRPLRLVRDRSDIGYRESFRRFMEHLGRGSCIVVVISKEYLESESCMFELTEIHSRGDLRDRVFPIVLDEAIYKARTRLRFVKHWEDEKKELNEALKEVDAENLDGIHEDLDLYSKIRTTVAGIMDILRDMNALTPEQHRGSDFQALFDAIRRHVEAAT